MAKYNSSLLQKEAAAEHWQSLLCTGPLIKGQSDAHSLPRGSVMMPALIHPKGQGNPFSRWSLTQKNGQ